MSWHLLVEFYCVLVYCEQSRVRVTHASAFIEVAFPVLEKVFLKLICTVCPTCCRTKY